jgi:hypothetical protein
MMQNSASWLDDLAGEKCIKKSGRANGYLQFGWLPKSGDLADIDSKFKVRLKLPQWNEKIALVIDNDDEDELKLDYEAARLHTDPEKEDLNLAVQYIKQLNQHLKVKNRIGLSRGQAYARSELKRDWQFANYSLYLSPRLDYYSSDGWAPGVKASLAYELDANLISLSASWQKVQHEQHQRQKIGLYHIAPLAEGTSLVTGIQYSNNEHGSTSYLLSARYRASFYRKWLFYEVEPFLEFQQVNKYNTEEGVALRLIVTYGH